MKFTKFETSGAKMEKLRFYAQKRPIKTRTKVKGEALSSKKKKAHAELRPKIEEAYRGPMELCVGGPSKRRVDGEKELVNGKRCPHRGGKKGKVDQGPWEKGMGFSCSLFFFKKGHRARRSLEVRGLLH